MHPDEPVVSSAYTRWLTTAEVTEQLKVGRRVIYRAVRQGKLRAAQIDARGDFRFKQEWIDAWVESCATPIERGVRR